MNKKIILACLLLGLLAGCSSSSKKDSGAVVEEHSSVAGEGDGGATAYGAGSGSMGDLSELNDPQSPLAVRVIYFAYDSNEIDPQYREIVEAHANFLAAHPDTVVALEGHADERGSREYNLALGERRSQAVKRQMTVLGVSNSQVRTTSYGEERPAVEGHDEAAWSQNRRVEILY